MRETSFAPTKAALSILVLMLLLSFNSVESRYTLDDNPHAVFGEKANCFRCHNRADDGTMINDEFIKTIPEYCAECHAKEDLGRSHPIGINPLRIYWKLRLPEDFHLDVYNNMTCITCHVSHGEFLSTEKSFPKEYPVNPDAHEWNEPFYYRTFYARRRSSDEGWFPLCKTCHEDY